MRLSVEKRSETQYTIQSTESLRLNEFPHKTHMNVGYARISTLDQNLQLQMDALSEAGCEKLFRDTASGALESRPGLDEAIKYVRKGDTLVVWRLDRLGRSLKHLIETVQLLEKRGVGFRSLKESLNTTTPTGNLIFQVIGAIAEFERNLVLERTRAGLAAARARGRVGGRPPKLDDSKRRLLFELYDSREDNGRSIDEICQLLTISRTTLYGYSAEAEFRDSSNTVMCRLIIQMLSIATIGQ